MKLFSNLTDAIYWGSVSDVSYLYGAHIEYLSPNHIYFKNPLMPSAQVIKEWSSKTTFQFERKSPSLPLLKRGQAYDLFPSIESLPFASVLVEILFYNRYGAVVGKERTRDNSLSFVYPLEAYSYKIRLLSAGVQEFHFYSFRLRESQQESGDE